MKTPDLKTLALAWSIAINTWCSALQNTQENDNYNSQRVEVVDVTKNQTQNILDEQMQNQKNLELYNTSLKIVWEDEIDRFVDYFMDWNDDKWEFVSKVKELQNMFMIEDDWILWSVTLRHIYTRVYAKNSLDLDFEALKRLQIYNDLLWYQSKPWALYHGLNPFALGTFYWENIWLNFSGTYINDNLVWKFIEELPNNQNLITFKKIEWKTALAMYIDWKLELATFWSAGRDDWSANTPWLFTTGQRNPSKLHTSSSYPKRESGNGWAVMPYAVHIDWPIRIHGSDSKIDWNPASAGCIRVWLFYIEHIYSRVSELWIQNVQIDTRNIY